MFHNSVAGDLIQIPMRFEVLEAVLEGEMSAKVLELAELDSFLEVPVDEVKCRQTSFQCYLQKKTKKSLKPVSWHCHRSVNSLLCRTF